MTRFCSNDGSDHLCHALQKRTRRLALSSPPPEEAVMSRLTVSRLSFSSFPGAETVRVLHHALTE